MFPRATGRTCAVLGAALLWPTRAEAQRWQVDAGASSIGYDTAGRLAAASVAPQLEWSRRALYALVSGNVAAFEGSTWMAQGWSDVSLVHRLGGVGARFQLEGAASLGGSLHSDGYRTGSTRAEARAHVVGRAAGAWLGGAAATGWTTGSGELATALGPTAGGWLRRRPVTATLIWTPSAFDAFWFHEVSGRASVTRGRVDVVAYAGWRSGPAGSGLAPETWGGATLAVWVAPRVAVVAAAGSYASDLLQALPRGRYLSIAVRFATNRAAVWAPSWTGRTIYAVEGDGEMRFRVPGAARVAVAGDWTGWQLVPLERAVDGQWVLRLRLAPGVYRFNLVADGARWLVPEGVVAVDDGFGGKTGLLVVP